MKYHNMEKRNYENLLNAVATETRVLPCVAKVPTFEHSPKKVIVFPLNKESNSLVRFSNDLSYEIKMDNQLEKQEFERRFSY